MPASIGDFIRRSRLPAKIAIAAPGTPGDFRRSRRSAYKIARWHLPARVLRANRSFFSQEICPFLWISTRKRRGLKTQRRRRKLPPEDVFPHIWHQLIVAKGKITPRMKITRRSLKWAFILLNKTQKSILSLKFKGKESKVA